MNRKRTCPQCERVFEHEIARGKDRKYCSDFCRSRARAVNAKSQPLCIVSGCKNHRGYSSGICNACYTRLRRTGTLERRTWAYRCVGTNGYVRISSSDHALAGQNGYVYEHRKVLYDAIGDGVHACHWCGGTVRWIKGACRKGALVADHLDGDKLNNVISNLVPACNACNATRGLFMSWVHKHKDDPVLWQMYQQAMVTARHG